MALDFCRPPQATHENAELGKLLFKSNILHITSYFIMDVVYYSYILLKIQCNLLILHIKLLNKSNLIIITL